MKTSGLALALAGAALALSAPVIARPGGGGGMGGGAGPMGHSMGSPASGPTNTNTPQGPINGQGWNHSNGPTHATGQPNQSCGSALTPFTPGNAANAPGSAFNPSGNAGSKYAGEQAQNQRNSASVSQYDSACAHQR